MRAFTRTLTVAGSIAAAIAVGGLSTAYAAGTTLSKGHVDVLDVEYAAGALELHVHDESVTPDVEYAPADVVLQALPTAAYTVPTGTCYSHLGTAGSTVYRLPQVENANLLWPGISGEHLSTGVFQSDKVQVKLTSVSGPGKLTVYKNGLCPKSNRSYDSGDATLTNTRDVAAGEHDHANWVFTKAGSYTATFQVSGTLTNGTPVGPTSATYAFQVG
ncbi:choice-of-anchor M domain-containing protein [Streptomyces sp. NBC_00873]|uniref:choice-of-anchor M domain-containing protein n=1 Tax=unclassified Streptomyces TaxID=2593676 RepID=UPI00387012F5|nr:choice-of-anchor M domain-containing protein [Streptomyces sp. NBC_00873]WTA48988.1 choice-of-anchor M domain-containing protein [Streptomyces sp. NBC_00842]